MQQANGERGDRRSDLLGAQHARAAPGEPRGHQGGEPRRCRADADALPGEGELLQALDQPARTAVEAQAGSGIDQDAPRCDLLDRQPQRIELAQKPGRALLHADGVGRHELQGGAEGQRLPERHATADAAGLRRRRGQARSFAAAARPKI